MALTAVYVRSPESEGWNLIGFGSSKKEAEDKASRRLAAMPRGSKSKFVSVKKYEEAKEKL
jgi:hypothetical protein